MAQLKPRLRSAPDARDKARLQVGRGAPRGQPPLAELARLAGRARSPLQIWREAFPAGGLTQLWERPSPHGKSRPVAAPRGRRPCARGSKRGRWCPAGPGAAWLPETHGSERAAQSLSYWLGKAGGARRVPRPCPVQPDPTATAARRAGREANLDKLNRPKERAGKIWGAAESRFGLHPPSRRGGARRGQRVGLAREPRYEWEYVDGAGRGAKGWRRAGCRPPSAWR